MKASSAIRATCVVFLALVPLSGALAAGSQPDIRPGMWSGGYGTLEGDSPIWHSITADLQAGGAGLAGDLRGGGKIEAMAGPEGWRLTIRHEGRRLSCDARPAGSGLVGTCDGGDPPFAIQLVPEEPPDDATLQAMAGIYAAPDGGRIVISRSIHLLLNDIRSGDTRVLYADGANRFVAGERFAVLLPIGMRVRFEGDARSGYNAVVVQSADGSERRATRCCPYETEEFTFENDGLRLAGTLYRPPGAGPHPAVVMVHGSGRQTRTGAGLWPQFLVDRGFAVLAYDKRGTGASEGRYEMPGGGHDNMPHMKRRATDVTAAVRALKARSDIDAGQVGLVGGSQAGWVIPMVAEVEPIAFTVTFSGGATELSIEGRFSKWADEDGSGGVPIDEMITRLREYDPDDYDFRPHFRAQTAPGLWLYGGKDRSNPAVLCKELIEEIRDETGRDFTVVMFPDGNHGLWQARVGGAAEYGTLTGKVPGLYGTISDWLEARGFGAGPAEAAAAR